MSHHTVLKMGKLTASALVLGQLVGGCAYGEMRQVLRAEVASEARCPELQVSKVPAYAEGYAENQYRVVGCGIDRTYSCGEEASGLVKFGSAHCKFADNKVGAPGAGPASGPEQPPMESGGEDDFGDDPGSDDGTAADESGAG